MLFRSHPWLGAGFRPFSPAVYLQYSPDEKWNTVQDAHSIYFQVLAEHGFIGLGLYLAVIAVTMLGLRGIMRRTRRRPDLKFYFDAAQLMEVSLLGFLIAGAFLSMSYFDLFFHLVAITALLKVLVAAELAQEAPPEHAAAPLPARTPPRGPVPRPAPALPAPILPVVARAASFPRTRPAPKG